MVNASLTASRAIRDHWPEYVIEAWALGVFMVSAGVVTVFVEHPQLSIRSILEDADLRRFLIGLAMGVTAVALIYSPWGKRSGAHMNPAVTLAFLRLGKVHRWDAFFYILFQVVGGVLGVMLVESLFGDLFAEPPVSHVVTVPGKAGIAIAFAAEFLMAMLLMFTILLVSNHATWERFTGLAAGVLVATYITIEAPLSGMSINPARTLASAMPANNWNGWWIYLTAPVTGMLAGVELYCRCWPKAVVRRAKLVWSDKQRCIHSGYDPGSHSRPEESLRTQTRTSKAARGER